MISFLDGIYGGTGSTVETKPWFPLFERAFDGWSAQTGITFVYEPNDDGLDQGADGATGEIGVRGDVRISGADIDGDFGTLAFNAGPGNGATAGDMVIDTADAFYELNSNGPNGENRGLINVLMHEIGHGIGLGHVFPGDNTKLMEPTISLNFAGPQQDDLLGAQSLYGDRFTDNDTQATATDLGPIGLAGISIDDLSIDSNTDTDWYNFDAEAGQTISVAISPTGEAYQVQTIDGNENTGPLEDVDSRLNSDLRLEVYDSEGVLIQSSDINAEGGNEFATGIAITESGTFSMAVFGTSMLGHIPGTVTQTQFYSLAVQQSALSDPTLIAASPNNGELFSLVQSEQSSNVLNAAPTEVTLTFGGSDSIDPATLEDAVSVQYSESGDFADGNTVDVLIGFVELGDNGRNATIRFAENLADGFYQISVNSGLASRVGVPFFPVNPEPVLDNPDLVREVIAFEVELGGNVIAVVPQPIVPGVDNPDYLRQIEVYFDDLDLFQPGSNVSAPAFYQLIDTQNSVTTEDDVIANPFSVTLDPATRRATLTFAADLDAFVSSGDSLRLRIGDSVDFTAVPVAEFTPFSEPGLTSNTAATIRLNLAVISPRLL